MDYPSFFARFYDPIYDHMRTRVDRDFYLRKIAETNGPVLEIGAGTGRFFSEALHGGADIYAIDISPSMLDVLKTKINTRDHYRVSQQNAINFSFGFPFDLILAPFRVFSHLLTVEEQLMALNNICRYLTDRGRLIFDLYVPDPGMIAAGLDRVVDFDGEYAPGKKLQRCVTMKADIVNQISDITMEFTWDEEEQTRTEQWHFLLRYFFRFELEHLISLSDLQLVQMYGDFNEAPLGDGSREFIVVCRKQG
jgi:SAM-dependent methyltransferase